MPHHPTVRPVSPPMGGSPGREKLRGACHFPCSPCHCRAQSLKVLNQHTSWGASTLQQPFLHTLSTTCLPALLPCTPPALISTGACQQASCPTLILRRCQRLQDQKLQSLRACCVLSVLGLFWALCIHWLLRLAPGPHLPANSGQVFLRPWNHIGNQCVKEASVCQVLNVLIPCLYGRYASSSGSPGQGRGR